MDIITTQTCLTFQEGASTTGAGTLTVFDTAGAAASLATGSYRTEETYGVNCIINKMYKIIYNMLPYKVLECASQSILTQLNQ